MTNCPVVPLTELEDEETRTVATPLVGYKIATSDYASPFVVGATERYVVGSRHALASGAPTVAQWGYHFCVCALACLAYGCWKPEWRLLRVAVPAGAVVATDGIRYAAAALDVVADDTASVAVLLTGTLRIERQWGVVIWKTLVAGVRLVVSDDESTDVDAVRK
jgi:hypothetical protein